jgi:hypothetical protein
MKKKQATPAELIGFYFGFMNYATRAHFVEVFGSVAPHLWQKWIKDSNAAIFWLELDTANREALGNYLQRKLNA